MISAALALLETEDQRSELAGFYKEHKRRLLAFALVRLRDPAAAEDALQEAFMNISKYPKSFFKMDAHKRVSYVLIIIRNIISRMLGDESRRTDELSEDIADGAPSVEELALGNISFEELKRFISGMSPALRDAIELKAVSGLSNSGIAAALGISEAAARKRISTAYKQIKDFLNGEASNE